MFVLAMIIVVGCFAGCSSKDSASYSSPEEVSNRGFLNYVNNQDVDGMRKENN